MDVNEHTADCEHMGIPRLCVTGSAFYVGGKIPYSLGIVDD